MTDLERALVHVYEFIPRDGKCEDCVKAKALSYELLKRMAKEIEARSAARRGEG